jgi:hypothetical protein
MGDYGAYGGGAFGGGGFVARCGVVGWLCPALPGLTPHPPPLQPRRGEQGRRRPRGARRVLSPCVSCTRGTACAAADCKAPRPTLPLQQRTQRSEAVVPCTIKALTEVRRHATAHNTARPASRHPLCFVCASPPPFLPRPDPRLVPPTPQAVNANPLDDQLKLFGSEMGNVRGRLLDVVVGTTAQNTRASRLPPPSPS